MNPFKVSKFKKADDFLFWSIAFAILLVLLASFLALFLPVSDPVLGQRMLELTVTLDGVLFGFSGVMIGFFIRRSDKIREPQLKLSLWWALMAFWSYIMSIFIAFSVMTSLERQTFVFSVGTPITLTLFGSIFTSIYMVCIFIEEIFPAENELTKK
jgi:hypothetical protein